MRGVSLEELSSATRISTKFLTAIENGHWEQLPGGAFNRGYIRSASRYLGLDEDGMVAEYSLEANHGLSATVPLRVAARRASDRWKIAAGASGALVLLICLIFAGRFLVSKLRAPGHARPASVAAPAVSGDDAPGSPVASARATPLHLVVRVSSAAQVRVIADRNVVFEGRLEAGAEKEFSARQTFQVATRNSNAVRLELNGQLLPPFGIPGRPGSITLTAKDAKPSAGGVH
jgi:Helix-turn-helix domain/RodZ C-terminal domain